MTDNECIQKISDLANDIQDVTTVLRNDDKIDYNEYSDLFDAAEEIINLTWMMTGKYFD